MNLLRTTFLSSLALVFGVGAASAQEAYVRIQDGDRQGDAALQCAVAHFSHPDSDVEIVLYGVVHIADAEYYGRVQGDLDSYTTVLYEGVAPGENQTEPDEDMAALGDMQQIFGDMLGLTFQKDGIDYTRTNLRHADMTIDQLQEALGGGSINPMGGVMSQEQMRQMGPMLRMAAQFGKMMMENNPQMRDSLKLQLANQLGNADLGEALGGDMERVILYERNAVVMDVLADQLTSQTEGQVAIFYGAAHMPDFETRLGELGWSLTSKRWMSAWQIGGGVADDEGGSAPVETPATPTPTPTPQREDEGEDGPRWF